MAQCCGGKFWTGLLGHSPAISGSFADSGPRFPGMCGWGRATLAVQARRPIQARRTGASMRRLVNQANEYYSDARERARRRRSPWNLFLLPLGMAGWLAVWYGLFRLIWAFHVMIYPEHRLQDFWRRGSSSFLPSFLMVFAPLPGAIALGLALANCVAWLVGPARRAFDREATGYHGTRFPEGTTTLFKLAAWMLPAGLLVSLISAWLLRSL